MAEERTAPAAETEENPSEILRIRREKLTELRANGKDPFVIRKYDKTYDFKTIRDSFDALEGSDVSVAGRILSRRDMGKANFIDLVDESGKMQIYIKSDDIGADAFAEYRKWDIGDIVGVKGFVFRTRGAKSPSIPRKLRCCRNLLLPLPEKWHGLKDQDLRYRQRYVDLIVNPEVRDTFVKRSRIIAEIRNYLNERGFLEVETPILHNMAGGRQCASLYYAP